MPLFEGHRDQGLARLFIEMPDQAKDEIVWKWPDQYYDAEVYFVATRDIPNVEFGGPVDNLTDGPSGLVVTLRVFGELAYRVTDPARLLAKLIGTGAEGDFNGEVSTWVTDQTLAAIRAVLPRIVAEHGVLAMGEVQDASARAALAKANEALAPHGLALSAFAELNVNLPDGDAQQLKQLAATKAYTHVSGSFESAVRGEAALEIAGGVANGNVGADAGIVAGMMMGLPVALGTPAAGSPAPASASAPASTSAPTSAPASVPPPAPSAAPADAPVAHFCAQCGARLAPGTHFCANCGTAVPAS